MCSGYRRLTRDTSSHHTGHVTAALQHAVSIDIARVVSEHSARPPEEAARCLIPHKTRFTLTTLKRTLTETKTDS